MNILGWCIQCQDEKPVQFEVYPVVQSEVPNIGDSVSAKIIAKCGSCGSTVCFGWASFPDLRPDWSEYEKLREEMGL